MRSTVYTCTLRSTFVASPPIDRIDVAPPFIQRNSTQSNQHSAWPVIGIIGGALVFCGTFITRKLAIHPDVRITASKRAAVRGALVLVL